MTTDNGPQEHHPKAPAAAKGGFVAALRRVPWRAMAQKTGAYLKELWIALVPILQRGGKEIQRGSQKLYAFVGQHRQATAYSAGLCVLAYMFATAGVPEGPAQQETTRAALSGKDLFIALTEEYPCVQRGSHVAEGDTRGGRPNLVVLPDRVWQDMPVEQRNSIGSWLNTAGGKWEIRTGKMSVDGLRVLEAEPVVSSREWNQQLKD